MTIGYVITKNSGYLRKMYEKFLDNILYRRIIQKVSVFCPIRVDYPENFSIINSYTVPLVMEVFTMPVLAFRIKTLYKGN